MATNSTTLSGAVTFDADRVTVADGTGAAIKKFLQVDDEKMQILGVDQSPVLRVSRGQQGTAALPHATGTPAHIGDAADFPIIPNAHLYTYGVAGALTVAPGTHRLNTGTAGAMTLRVPTKGEDGLKMIITALTAHAYVVTAATTGFNGGGTGSDAATFGGAIGDSMEIEASNGTWLSLNLDGVTLG